MGEIIRCPTYHKIQDITDYYGLSLNDQWNILELPLQRRHPNPYHKWVLDNMTMIHNIPNMNRTHFLDLLNTQVKIILKCKKRILETPKVTKSKYIMKKYYACLVNAYDNKVGHFRYPKGYIAPKNMDEALMMMDKGKKLTLTDGPFPDYALGCLKEIISQDLKDLFDRYEDSKQIEYLPVLTTSAEYGDRMYYIPKLPPEKDIINLEESKCLEAQDIDGYHFDIQVLVPCFYYDKVKDKDIFTTRPYGFIDIVVSSRVMSSIRKEKLNKGLSFAPFYAK